MKWSGMTLFLVAPVILISAGFAQTAADSSRQIRDRMAVVKADFIEVRSGPAAAYTSVGRLYRGDQVTVRGEPGDHWVEIVQGDVKGWVALETLRIVPFKTLRTDEDGATDSGRDRRETNYRYDERGRRLRSDGQPMGSGEGISPPETQEQANTDVQRWIISIGGGFGSLSRQFYTNTAIDSLLYAVSVSPQGVASHLSLEWQAWPWWALKADLSDSRLGTTRFAEPTLNNGSPIEIESDHQRLFTGSRFTYPLGMLSIGAEVGVDMFRVGFQETKPIPILLSTQTWHGSLGGVLHLKNGPLEGDVLARLMRPLSIEQTPRNSGDSSGTGYGLSGRVRWWFSTPWGAQLHLSYSRMRIEYSGQNNHIDSVTTGGPYTYTEAVETNERWVVTVDLNYRF